MKQNSVYFSGSTNPEVGSLGWDELFDWTMEDEMSVKLYFNLFYYTFHIVTHLTFLVYDFILWNGKEDILKKTVDFPDDLLIFFLQYCLLCSVE